MPPKSSSCNRTPECA